MLRHTVLMSEHERSPEDQWHDQSMSVVQQFGAALLELNKTNPFPDLPLLPRAINHLMTELWDSGFSQSEIREAFNDAVTDISRYAAGDEVRS